MTSLKQPTSLRTFSPDQRIAMFLMSAPRAISRIVLEKLPLEHVRVIASTRAALPGLSSEERRVILASVARTLGTGEEGLSVSFYQRPEWAVSMLGYWAARSSYVALQGAA